MRRAADDRRVGLHPGLLRPAPGTARARAAGAARHGARRAARRGHDRPSPAPLECRPGHLDPHDRRAQLRHPEPAGRPAAPPHGPATGTGHRGLPRSGARRGVRPVRRGHPGRDPRRAPPPASPSPWPPCSTSSPPCSPPAGPTAPACSPSCCSCSPWVAGPCCPGMPRATGPWSVAVRGPQPCAPGWRRSPPRPWSHRWRRWAARAPDAFEPRSLVDTPRQDAQVLSPLPMLAVWADQTDLPLVRVDGTAPGRLTLAVLPDFDGATWSNHGRFTVPGAEPVPDLPVGAAQLDYAVTVHVDTLTGGWIPSAGRPTAVDLDDLRVDADSGALVSLSGLKRGSDLPARRSGQRRRRRRPGRCRRAHPGARRTLPAHAPAAPRLQRLRALGRRQGHLAPGAGGRAGGAGAVGTRLQPQGSERFVLRPAHPVPLPAGRVLDRDERAVRRLLRRAGPVDRPALPAGGGPPGAGRVRRARSHSPVATSSPGPRCTSAKPGGCRSTRPRRRPARPGVPRARRCSTGSASR